MHTEPITMDRSEAQRLYRAYKTHLHYSTPIDHEIMRAYQLLAKGRLIIKAIETVAKAGLGADGLPKLALCRADVPAVRCRVDNNGVQMLAEGATRSISWRRSNEKPGNRFTWPLAAFSVPTPYKQHWDARAALPPIPLHQRPARGVANYHILWEAEWTKIPPRDPYLLRRIGVSDMWLVVAMWDLTDVERTALASRL
jgi:hypothetical protein